MSEEEIKEIVKLLENDNPALRQLAIEQLAPHKDNHISLNAIIRSLHDKDQDVRSYAVDVLGDVDDRQALIALSQALEDDSWKVRESVISSFGKLGKPETTHFIIEALRDNHPQVRFTAAKELKKFDEITMIEPLFEVLKDETDSVREEAKSTLLNFRLNVPAPLVAKLIISYNKFVREVAVEFLSSRVEGNPFPYLEKTFDDQEWEIRLLTLKEIGKHIEEGKIDDPILLNLNLNAIKDDNSRVRYQAISNLGMLKSKEALEPLGEIARNDEDHNNRLMATETMTAIRRALRLEGE
ncbi:MAG: HEAT repeat domain-containing protein [Candidatus Heimdallarchaeota archaeon]|nr:HEAT repeat domain-containing protein [Candidatus Heimdallarchaeota archaeon]MCK4954685.1 HEAT repeat domain-containing protein [Candidatus Heimdallarchaeota archaeon]